MIDGEDYRTIAQLEELLAEDQIELGFVDREEILAKAKKIVSSYGAFLRRANRAIRASEEKSDALS